MPELGKWQCGRSFFYAVINFKEEQMENIIDLKNPRKQKVAWIIHGFAVKVAESHIVIFVKNMDFVQIVYSKNG